MLRQTGRQHKNNRWTDSNSDRKNNILIAGDKYTKVRKIMFSLQRYKTCMYYVCMYICINVCTSVYFSENNVMIYVFTSFLPMRLHLNGLCNFTPSEVAELKANPLQSHVVLHSLRHNIARQPPWSYHSRKTMITAETTKP